MKPQAYPSSKIKVGCVLYACTAWTDDARKTTTEIDEWIVRSIRAKRGAKTRMGFKVRVPIDTQFVNITRKIEHLTWGRLSPKIGHYGWKKTIARDYTKSFAVGSDLPRRIYTTVRAAVAYELDSVEASIKDPLGWEEQELADLQRQATALKRRLNTL